MQKVNINGCLVFFFNPCCETFGFKIELQEPVVLSASGSIIVDVEAFSVGINIGSDDININPLSNINLAGFSPVIGSWSLPPILDQFVSISNQNLCAKLGVPGSSIGLDFCVALNNFTAAISGVNVCPRLTISFGNQKLLDISYTALSDNLPECLSLTFLPTCSHNGAAIPPDIIQLFKSGDSNNDQKIILEELEKAKALLGIFESKAANTESFVKMDANNDGGVDFTEFASYTKVQTEVYEQSPSGRKDSTTYSRGDIAIAVIVTMIGTALIVCAVLVGVAQRKGVVNIGWLGKIIPSK